jgi:hypothetical protein
MCENLLGSHYTRPWASLEGAMDRFARDIIRTMLIAMTLQTILEAEIISLFMSQAR